MASTPGAGFSGARNLRSIAVNGNRDALPPLVKQACSDLLAVAVSGPRAVLTHVFRKLIEEAARHGCEAAPVVHCKGDEAVSRVAQSGRVVKLVLLRIERRLSPSALASVNPVWAAV